MPKIQNSAVEDVLKKTVILRRFSSIFAVLTIAVMISFAAHAQEDPVDFSGTWKMDASRSVSAHQDAPIGPVTMIVRQSGRDLTIEIKSREPHSSTVHSETLSYKLDGTEITTKAADGTPIKCKAHWEGPKLVAETTRDIEKFPVSMSYVYSLDSEGKEMKIIKTLLIQHGYESLDAKTNNTGADVFIKTLTSDLE